MHRPFHRLLVLGLLAALGGCGLKGPLYMPSTHPAGKAKHHAAHVPTTRAPAATSSAPALPADDDSDSTGGPG